MIGAGWLLALGLLATPGAPAASGPLAGPGTWVVVGAPGPLVRAAGPGDERTGRADTLRSAQVAEMVQAAHGFLLEHQNADGSFSVVRGRSAKNAPVAVTGLAALFGFLAAAAIGVVLS